MKFVFRATPRPPQVESADWFNWQWQARHALKTRDDFARVFTLSDDEELGLAKAGEHFQIRVTPYYAELASHSIAHDPIRRILMPTKQELLSGTQSYADPLAERRHSPVARIVHRYSDRVLFLLTDTCSVYCRYCTRKYFTGNDEAFVRSAQYEKAVDYIRGCAGLREVILSGGDPLTLSDGILDRVLHDLRAIEHVEIIRIGTRMPVVNPMRMTLELAKVIQRHQPVYVMTHFNHPRELSREAAEGLTLLADHGVPLFNQLVLLNGVNNHPAIVQALSRRLLYLRVKPYYMHQCDPSEGTDHLRTSIEESMAIQRELWGHLSGLAMPNLSVDLPDGGGKVGLVPEFEVERNENSRAYVGWDGVRSKYVNPSERQNLTPLDAEQYLEEWLSLKSARESAKA